MPAGGRYGFPRSVRVSEAEAYRRVFSKPKKSTDSCFTVLWRRNGFGQARLGLAVSKKNAPRAVDRNRIKRLIRENFRQIQEQLPAQDIVVLSRRGIAERTNQQIIRSLETHWEKLIRHG